MRTSPNRCLLVCFIVSMMLVKVILIFQNKLLVELNADEYVNYNIAKNYVNGLGFTHSNWQDTRIEPHAFYSSFPVFVFVLLFWLGIPLLYYIKGVLLAMVLAYGASIYYFYKLLRLFTNRNWLMWLALIIYAMYPSVVFYIGTLFWYENLAAPGLIYVLYSLLYLLQNNKDRNYTRIADTYYSNYFLFIPEPAYSHLPIDIYLFFRHILVKKSFYL